MIAGDQKVITAAFRMCREAPAFGGETTQELSRAISRGTVSIARADEAGGRARD